MSRPLALSLSLSHTPPPASLSSPAAPAGPLHPTSPAAPATPARRPPHFTPRRRRRSPSALTAADPLRGSSPSPPMAADPLRSSRGLSPSCACELQGRRRSTVPVAVAGRHGRGPVAMACRAPWATSIYAMATAFMLDTLGELKFKLRRQGMTCLRAARQGSP